MEVDIGKLTEKYEERMKRIGLFSFLYSLKSKKQSDQNNVSIDYFDAGVLFLLFLFENMLMRNHQTSIKETALFFQKHLSGRYSLDEAGFYKIAETIAYLFRPPSGNRPAFSFYNWNTGEQETVYYRFLKRSKADIGASTQYFTLDEDGLELIFATKEYFSELQISINQLLIRKQLEKGEFAGALRQIDEMRIEVMALKERIIKIKHEIQRNIVSDEIYARYQNMIEDISLRLKRENLEFGELIAFVEEIQNRFGYDIEMVDEKDRRSYQYILQIDKELDEVHFEHKSLLDESVMLQKSALQAAREALYYAGISAFNFKQEITAMFFSLPLPVEESRKLVEPFLYLGKAKVWNPLRLLAPQRIDRVKKEAAEVFLQPRSDQEWIAYIERQAENFAFIMQTVAKIMGDRPEIYLTEIIADLRERNPELLERRIFYDFFMLLHQKSPLSRDKESEEALNQLYVRIFGAVDRRYQRLKVLEETDIIRAYQDKWIQNMRIILEED